MRLISIHLEHQILTYQRPWHPTSRRSLLSASLGISSEMFSRDYLCTAATESLNMTAPFQIKGPIFSTSWVSEVAKLCLLILQLKYHLIPLLLTCLETTYILKYFPQLFIQTSVVFGTKCPRPTALVKQTLLQE